MILQYCQDVNFILVYLLYATFISEYICYGIKQVKMNSPSYIFYLLEKITKY